jgi:thymidylate synthase ThyX
MPYEAKIVLDSINTHNGKRLTTWQLTYPRFVHAELMTHRLFSRNAASSRAIPVKKLIERIKNDPAMPVYWGKNQSGMQAAEELSAEGILEAKADWLEHRDKTIEVVEYLIQKYNLHKQIANRLLEPWMYITVILTATEFGNWFNLRCHKDAQPEIKHLADMMDAAYVAHKPEEKYWGEWHIPFVRFDEWEDNTLEVLKKVAVARIARVSYLNHDGTTPTIQDDIKLHDRLEISGHWSPFEHVACAMQLPEWSGNFMGWKQYRKEFQEEHRSLYKSDFEKPTLPEMEDICSQ